MKRVLMILVAVILIMGIHEKALADGFQLPVDLKTIEDGAFEGVNDLFSITLPESIKRIGSRAFADSDLVDITLPSSLEYIADDAFADNPWIEVTVEQGSYAHKWTINNGSKSGVVPGPQISIPDSIKNGEDFSVSIEPVPGAVHYYGWYDSGESHREIQIGHSLGYSAEIPGYWLRKGKNHIYLTAVADGGSRTNTVVSFDITDDRPIMNAPSVSSSVVRENEQFTISIDTTGASALWYECQHGPYGSTNEISVNEDMTQLTFSKDEIGFYSYTFMCKYDDVWSEKTEATTVKVIYADGTDIPEVIDPPVIHIPDNIKAGEDFVITVDPLDGALYYYGWLIGDKWEHELAFDKDSQGNLSCWIDGYKVDPGSYTVSVTAVSVLYKDYTTKVGLSITGSKQPAPIVSCNTLEATLNSTIEINIESQNAELIHYEYSYPYGSGSYGTINANNPTTTIPFKLDEVGNYYFSYAVKKNGLWTEECEPLIIQCIDND